MAKSRWRAFGRCQGVAISLMNQLELALPNQVLKSLYDLAHGRRADVLKIPASRAHLIESPKQVVRGTRDRFRNRSKIDICRNPARGRFSDDGQKQTKMLAQRQR